MSFDPLKALGYNMKGLLSVPENAIAFRDRLLAVSEIMWRRTRNPVYVWEAIWVFADLNEYLPDSKLPYPMWIQEYLEECALNIKHLLRDAAPGEISDVRRLLPAIFGFAKQRGRGSAFSLVLTHRTDEELAMRFAAAIYGGLTPVKAREEAAEILPTVPDAEALRLRINAFFGVGRGGPKNISEWRRHLTQFFERANAGLSERARSQVT